MVGKVRINSTKANAAVAAMSQAAVMRGADRYRERVREEILEAGRVQTGEMYTRIDVRPLAPQPGRARAQVKPQAEHFLYQDQGTNGHTMPPGKVMVWKGRGGVFVFARKVKGVKAGRFLLKARQKMKIQDFA